MGTMGIVFVVIGWIGVLTGRARIFQESNTDYAYILCAVNSFLAVSGGAILGLICEIWQFTTSFDTIGSCVLSALVSISASCCVVEHYTAFLIGFSGAVIHVTVARYLMFTRIGAQSEFIATHLVCGVWGTISAGLFSSDKLYSIAYSGSKISCGLVYWCENQGGWQFLANFIIAFGYIIFVALVLSIVVFPLLCFGLLEAQAESINGFASVKIEKERGSAGSTGSNASSTTRLMYEHFSSQIWKLTQNEDFAYRDSLSVEEN